MVHLIFLLEAKLTSVTKVETSMSQKRFTTIKQKLFCFEQSHIKSQKLPQPKKKMECPVTVQTKKILLS